MRVTGSRGGAAKRRRFDPVVLDESRATRREIIRANAAVEIVSQGARSGTGRGRGGAGSVAGQESRKRREDTAYEACRRCRGRGARHRHVGVGHGQAGGVFQVPHPADHLRSSWPNDGRSTSPLRRGWWAFMVNRRLMRERAPGSTTILRNRTGPAGCRTAGSILSECCPGGRRKPLEGNGFQCRGVISSPAGRGRPAARSPGRRGR